MKQLQMLLGLGVLLIVFGSFLAGIHRSRAGSYSQIAPGITTAGGITAANLTLVKPLLDNDIVAVTGVTSSVSDPDETPAPTTYNTLSHILTVSGLKESTSRTLTVTFEYSQLDSPSDSFMKILPLLMIVGGVFVAGWGVYSGFKH